MITMSVGAGIACCGGFAAILGGIHLIVNRNGGNGSSNGWGKVLTKFNNLLNEVKIEVAELKLLVGINKENVTEIKETWTRRYAKIEAKVDAYHDRLDVEHIVSRQRKPNGG